MVCACCLRPLAAAAYLLLNVQHLHPHKRAESIRVQWRRHRRDAISRRPSHRQAVQQSEHDALYAPSYGKLLEHINNPEEVDLLPVAADGARAPTLLRELIERRLLLMRRE